MRPLGGWKSEGLEWQVDQIRPSSIYILDIFIVDTPSFRKTISDLMVKIDDPF